jgi:tRNA pseudouridine65 synthase
VSAPAESFWTTLPLGRGFGLLTRDANGLAAFAKPAGGLSHPNTPEDQSRSLLDATYVTEGEFFQWTTVDGAVRRLWLLNRLDGATSGVILAAASAELAGEIRRMFQHKQVRKVYNALVFGVPTRASDVWRDRLAVQRKRGVVRTGVGGNIPAEAAVTVLRQQRAVSPPLALIQLEPRTGRSHQLRVQCAKRHLPIVGDATYGDFAANRAFAKKTGEKRLFLHSLETTFEYEFGGRTHRFTAKAPLPEAFVRVLG